MSWTGLAAGIESGLRSYERVKRIEANDARYKAEQDKLDREARDRDLTDDINKTMSAAFGGDMNEAAPAPDQAAATAQPGTLRSMIGVQSEPQQTPSPQSGSLRARFSEGPATPQGQGMSTPPAQRGPGSLKEAGAQQEVPRERRMVDAYRKGWERAFELGRPDLAMPYFQKETELRETLTKQALDKADRAFALAQDPRVYVSTFNDLNPDGTRIESMMPELMKDGSQAWKVVSRMPGMDEPVEQVIPGDQIGMLVQQLHDPAAVRKAQMEVAQKMRESLLKREEKKYEIGLRANADRALETQRTAGRLSVVIAQGKEARKTAKYKDELPNTGKAASAAGTKAPPAAVATAQWLIDNGVAKDATQAWGLVRTASSKSKEGAIMDLTRSIMSGPSGMQYAGDPGKAAALARQIVDQIEGAEKATAADGEEDFSSLWQ